MRILYQDYILYNTYPGFSGKKKYTTLFSPYCFWGMDLGNQRQRLNIPIPHRLPRSGQWNYIWSGFSCPQEWWNQCNMDILRSKQMLPRKQTVFSSIWLCSCFFLITTRFDNRRRKQELLSILSVRYTFWMSLFEALSGSVWRQRNIWKMSERKPTL